MARRPLPAIRWTQAVACKEFGITVETFGKRWRLRDLPPDEDDTWSTKDVCAIVFGDKEGERLRLTTEQADKVALENAEKRRDLIPVDTVLIAGQRFIGAAKAKILGSKLSDQEKDEILQELANLGTKRVAEAQDL